MDTFSNSTPTGLSRASHHRLEEAIDVASRLAGTDAIGAVHVTVSERPTYDELRMFQQIAACHGLTLTMTADSIILRPKPIDPELADGAPALGVAALLPGLGKAAGGTLHRVHDRLAASHTLHWVHDHAANWNAGFQGLREGTR